MWSPATEAVGEAWRSCRAEKPSTAAEFLANGEVVDGDAVVTGGERIGRGTKLDEGKDLWAAPKPLGRRRKVRSAAEPSGGDETSSL